jgi:hypothetical protein
MGWYPETDFYRVTYQGGRYVVGPRVRLPSPVSTVDDLLGAAQSGDGKRVAKLTDPSVRKIATKYFAANHHVYVRTPDTAPYWSMPQPRLDVQNYDQDPRYRMRFRKVRSRYVLIAMEPLQKPFSFKS